MLTQLVSFDRLYRRVALEERLNAMESISRILYLLSGSNFHPGGFRCPKTLELWEFFLNEA